MKRFKGDMKVTVWEVGREAGEGTEGIVAPLINMMSPYDRFPTTNILCTSTTTTGT